jgi:hypothetical protein
MYLNKIVKVIILKYKFWEIPKRTFSFLLAIASIVKNGKRLSRV